jgi:hypothetical protein
VSGFGAWRGTSAPEAVAAADPPKTTPALPPQNPPVAVAKPAEPVATIFGDVPVSRDEFADYLIRKYGKKELEQFVNKQIIAHAFKQKGFTLKAEDVAAALEEDCKGLGMTRAEFAKTVLPRYGKTLEDWAKDVIEPRLMMERLCKEKMHPVTEAELRQAFEAKHGEKVQCRIVHWRKDDEAEARKGYEKLLGGEDFERLARRSSEPALARSHGLVAPIPRTPAPGADEKVHPAVMKLKVGELSPLLETADGWVVIKCEGVIPVDKTKSFETEKPVLLPEVVRAKIERELPKLLKELKQQANPKYHLTAPDPAAPPAPAKKP